MKKLSRVELHKRLLDAARSNNIASAKEAIAAGGDLETRNKRGDTALIHAPKWNHIEKKVQKILKEFTKENYLDFRKHKYLHNNENLTPIFDYDLAEKIVIKINEKLIEEFGEQRVIYNLEMDLQRLQTSTLKSYLEERILNYLFY